MRLKKYLVLSLIIILASCKTVGTPVNNLLLDNSQSADFTILERPLPDSRGIITYTNYQIFVARGAESVADIGNRLKINPSQLASYNGVLTTYIPRKEEVLAIPVKISGDIVKAPLLWNQEQASSLTAFANRANPENLGTPDNPFRHRVEAGDTAYSVARLYNVSVTSLAKWNGLDADLNLVIGRELIIPVILKDNPPSSKGLQANSTNQQEAAETLESGSLAPKIAPTTSATSSGTANQDSEIKQQKSNETKNIENTVLVFARPVPGRILKPYNPTAIKDKNEGLDFQASPGTIVMAAADGVVALISKPVGGLGKIILIKHRDSYISIYGRVKDLKVSKGSRVTKGQAIGSVENALSEANVGEKNNFLHFELRKGTKSVDPEPLLK